MIRLKNLFYLTLCGACVLSATAKNDGTKALVGKWIQSYHKASAGVKNRHIKVTWSEDEAYCYFKIDSPDASGGRKLMQCDTRTGKISAAKNHRPSHKKPVNRQHRKRPQAVSPDGKWKAFVKDGSVYLKKNKNNTTTCVGKPDIQGCYYQGTAQWNADSTHFILPHVEPGQRRIVTVVESSPKGSLQPKEHRYRYDKPGDKIDRREPRSFSIDGKTIHKPNPSLTKNAFQINHAQWDPDGKEMTYEYIERGFGKHYLISRNAITGKERLLIKEESDTFIFVGNIRFRKDIPESNEIIWASERDGWRHLYLLDAKTGKIKNQITQGDWVVRGTPLVDLKTRSITFRASGKNKTEDPYHIHWYRINFDGTQLTPLTKGDGNHSITYSPHKKYYVDTWSRVDHPPVHELRRTSDGRLIKILAKADTTGLLQQGRKLPKRFVCKDRNDRFDIWGVIFTPPNYDPNKRYPVIENIYAGPHGAFATKEFAPWISHLNELTEEGFVVVQIDGLGTNFRHRDFSHFSYKNLIDSGFPDRIKWIKAAAKKFPFMDTSRVGIYGGSAGGQSSTAAVLHHGDFYKAAVSDCGCHDNRMDKIWWNEQWMDWPVAKHYKEQSNVTNAHKLSGALMLTVGELDKNVDPASTTQLVAALMKADQDFEYYIAPSGGHGSGEKAYLRRKRFEFFRHHLGSAK